MNEKTLILLKPDTMERCLVGDIINRFEKKGLKIAGLKMLKMTEDMASRHYQEHQGESFYSSLVKFITSRPIIAMLIEGPGAVSICRSMTGATFGAKAAPGTIRGDFGISTRFNLIHSSENREAAKKEISIFFEQNVNIYIFLFSF